MKLHKNARTCPNCRRIIARQVIEERRPISEVASEFSVSRQTIARWLSRYRDAGEAGLLDRSSAPHTVPNRYPPPDDSMKNALFAILHSPPSSHGLNRTTWRMADLVLALRAAGFATNEPTVARVIRAAGYRWRKARVVLTSNDRRFREKVDQVRTTLANLREDEAFFSVDEFGPFAIRLRGGRSLVPPGRVQAVPQWQRSRGTLIVTAGLELSGNQVSHFFSSRKNTEETIRLLRLLAEQYRDRRHLFVSWDAAPWHRSRALFAFLAEHNASAARQRAPSISVVPLPARAQFMNVIESVFSGMARAIIHNSDYATADLARCAIDRYFAERNQHFFDHPRRAGVKIWRRERVPTEFNESSNCKDPRYG